MSCVTLSSGSRRILQQRPALLVNFFKGGGLYLIGCDTMAMICKEAWNISVILDDLCGFWTFR